MKLVPHTGIALQLAVLDGIPGRPNYPHGTHILIRPDDDVLVATEAAYLWMDGNTAGNGPRWLRRHQASRLADVPFRARLVLGAWRYTGSFADLVAVDAQGRPVQRAASTGLYAQAEGKIFQEPEDPNQGLSVFAQIGYASERVNRFTRYTGGGWVYRGLFPGRSGDRLGFAIAVAFNGRPYEAAQSRSGRTVGRAEVDLECTYQAPVTPWFALQGDVQYVEYRPYSTKFSSGSNPDPALVLS